MIRLLCALAIVACSTPAKPKEKPPGPAAAMTPEQFCAGIQTGPSAYLAKCSDADKQSQRIAEIAHGANGADKCEMRMRSLAKKRITFDAARAKSCVDDWQKRIAANPKERQLGPACVGVIAGTVAVDGACDEDYECKGAARCAENKCVAAPAEEGDSCTGGILPTFETDHANCENKLLCTAKGSRRASCTKPTAIGEDCSGIQEPCADGGVCVDKKCVAKAPIVDIGGTCATVEAGEMNQLLECAPNAYCPIRGMKDKASCIAKKAAGGACTEDDECLGRCAKATSTCEALCGSG